MEKNKDEDMRPRVPWMTKNDDAVLEWLDEVDMPSPPKQIHLTMEGAPSYTTINRRLRKLDEVDMVEKHPDAEGYYQITEKGRRYLHDPNAKIEEFLLEEEDDEEDDENEGS